MRTHSLRCLQTKEMKIDKKGHDVHKSITYDRLWSVEGTEGGGGGGSLVS